MDWSQDTILIHCFGFRAPISLNLYACISLLFSVSLL